jgi:endogenous inhibitor of DNA gyrase (YacG/DUF329 family)
MKTRRTIKCKTCSKQFVSKLSRIANGRGIFCSKACANVGIDRSRLAGLYSEHYFDIKPDDRNLPARLYLLKIENNVDGVYFKIGITINTVKHRHGKNGYIILDDINMPLYQAWTEEQRIIKDNALSKYVPINYPLRQGKSECFSVRPALF